LKLKKRFVTITAAKISPIADTGQRIGRGTRR
jgi:hypothetical protein